jgi:ABC-type transport system involved in multi-copper enzyme maturation permease subunit
VQDGELHWPHLRTLGALEHKRLAPQLLKQLGFMATVGAVGVMIKGAEAVVILYIVLFAAVASVPAFAATNVGKDKADGSLDVLCSLPVSSWTLCLGRMTAVALLSTISGALGSLAAVLSLPPTTAMIPRVLIAMSAFWMAWSGPVLLTALVTGAAVRFTAEHMIRAAAIGFLVAILGSKLLAETASNLLTSLLGTASPQAASRDLIAGLMNEPYLLAGGVAFMVLGTFIAGGLSALFLVTCLESFRTQNTAK